jgi:hypothetical protein
MAERRSLMEGLLELSPEVDPVAAEDFISNGTPKSAARPKERKASPAPAVRESQKEPLDVAVAPAATSGPMSRAPLTTRIRADYAAALKRASLERQLEGVSPNTQQDILEEALEPWLRTNHYLN